MIHPSSLGSSLTCTYTHTIGIQRHTRRPEIPTGSIMSLGSRPLMSLKRLKNSIILIVTDRSPLRFVGFSAFSKTVCYSYDMYRPHYLPRNKPYTVACTCRAILKKQTIRARLVRVVSRRVVGKSAGATRGRRMDIFPLGSEYGYGQQSRFGFCSK